jgi:ParB family chromosome partitioning protein
MASPKLQRRAAAMVSAAAQGSGHDRLFGTSNDFPRLVELDVAQVHRNPDQPRRHFDDSEIESLAASIARHGLQQPVLVRQAGPGAYRLVAGERRLRAHLKLGKPTIFAIITDGDPDELALIENLQRVDLDALEVASALALLVDKHGYTHAQLGGIVGRSQAEVTRTLRLLDLPEVIRTEYTTSYRQVPKSVMVEIAAIDDDAVRRRLWEQAKAGATVKDVRQAKKAGAPAPAERGNAALLRAARGLGPHLQGLEEAKAAPGPEERARLVLLRDQIDRLLRR